MPSSRADGARLEQLIDAEFKIAKWDGQRGPSYDPFSLSRHEFLVDEILAVSGTGSELRALRSSRRVELVENVMREIRGKSTRDSNSILTEMKNQLSKFRKQYPIQKYTAVWPIAISLDFFVKTPKSYLVDNNFVSVLRLNELAKKFFPRTRIKGRMSIDGTFLTGLGFDIAKVAINDPAFFVTDVYASDAWYVVLESGTRIELFLSLSDLAGSFWSFDAYPISPYPDPSVCLVFSKPLTVPESSGNWNHHEDWLRKFVFRPAQLSLVLRTINMVRKSDVWPVIKASLIPFRRAMSRNNREDSLINFWTACEIAVSAGTRLRDEQAAQVMKKVFTGSWPEFSAQVDRFLALRNKLLHEGVSEIMWYDIHFAKQTFEYLLAILFDYAKRGKSLSRLTAAFATAKLSLEQRQSMYEALQDILRIGST